MATETLSPTLTLTSLNVKLFEAIGALAIELDRFQLKSRDGSDADDMEEEQNLSNLVCGIRRIGWMADLGAKRNGGSGQLEDAIDWLLSPSLREALVQHEIAEYQRDNPAPASTAPKVAKQTRASHA